MQDFNILNLNIYYVFFYFSIYSFLGWCTEIFFTLYKEKKFINKGFLKGPFCSIYGFGACILITVLDPLKSEMLLLFAASLLFTSVLEYVAGYVLEKFFKKAWWNYKDEPFNLHGRICLKFSIFWGILSELTINVIHPLVHSLTTHIPYKYVLNASCLLALYFVIDLTAVAASHLRSGEHLKQLDIVPDHPDKM